MNIYYTTSAGEDQHQPKTSASLGGYKAQNTVKNDDFDNVFSEISAYTINQNKDQYIALVIKNDLPATKSNVQVWIEDVSDNPYCKYEVSAIQMSADSEGVDAMERTRDIFSRPYYADFQELNADSKGVIGTMAVGAKIGIWIKRSLVMENINNEEVNLYVTSPDNPNRVTSTNIEKQEKFKFHVSWD
jgi:hypothetical protein